MFLVFLAIVIQEYYLSKFLHVNESISISVKYLKGLPVHSLSYYTNLTNCTNNYFFNFFPSFITSDPLPGRPTHISPSSAREILETQSSRFRPGLPPASGSAPGSPSQIMVIAMGMRVVTLVTRVRVPNFYNVNPTMMRVTTSSSVGFWPMALITPNSSWAEIAPLPSWKNILQIINMMDGWIKQ